MLNHILEEKKDIMIAQQEKSHRVMAWLVTITASLFFFYEFIQMHLFNTINVQLRETFQLNAGPREAGQLSATSRTHQKSEIMLVFK